MTPIKNMTLEQLADIGRTVVLAQPLKNLTASEIAERMQKRYWPTDGQAVGCEEMEAAEATVTAKFREEHVGMKWDDDKALLQLIPPGTMTALAETMTECLTRPKPYKMSSWKHVTPRHRYLGALMRHVDARLAGEEFDPKSKLRHTAHILFCAAVLNYFERKGEDILPPEHDPKKSQTDSDQK
jgi:hypothetical protein